MSNLSDKIKIILKELFPHYRLEEEYFVSYKGQKLYFDFYLPDFSLFIEVQGKQHCKFIEHFHGTRENFLASRKRDNMKIDYVDENEKNLLIINEEAGNKMTKGKLLSLVGKVQKEKYCKE